MGERQASDLYLGRSRHVFGLDPEAGPAAIYEQPTDSELRARFYRAVNGMDIKQVNAYWARLRFSGEVLPPPVLADSLAVLEAVRNNRLAIGYVDAALPEASLKSVKTVLRLKE